MTWSHCSSRICKLIKQKTKVHFYQHFFPLALSNLLSSLPLMFSLLQSCCSGRGLNGALEFSVVAVSSSQSSWERLIGVPDIGILLLFRHLLHLEFLKCLHILQMALLIPERWEVVPEINSCWKLPVRSKMVLWVPEVCNLRELRYSSAVMVHDLGGDF
jgi:hypothetical protein